MNYQEKVREFQIKGGEDLESGLTPLRESLLKEEINELKEAIANNDRVEILDALCDIKYVNDGNANLMAEETELVEDVFWHNSIFTKPLNNLMYSLSSTECDDIHIINALVGIIASTSGFKLENFKEALNRVHESNMSKFPKSEDEAIETVKDYEKKGVETYYTDTFVVKRKLDNKTLKSINYKPVYLEDLI